ncbi:hypothetical protein LTR56_027362 [Elasticomyces elasticus]|nr:hypothetical protein LTR56_027362 [Elasticomyces elasticus]KAK4903032.1 hypothetical protein LTR49_026907 [Elasticomyces elasticus]KAK5737867.1 hypothetical protein LTS12_025757 [Elasticomyces elasticus]
MDNTNSTRDFSSTRMTPPQQTAHERTTKMDTSTEKHQGSSVAFDTSSNLLHVRASGHKTHPKHLYTEHDAYVQDIHQEQDAGGKKSTGPDESAYLERSQSGESVYEDAEEPDLFTKSFPHAKEEDKHEIEIISRPSQIKTKTKSATVPDWAKSSFKSPPTYGPIPSDELPTSIVSVTAQIEGHVQTFDVFPFAVITRNDIATRHVVAKDIKSSKFIAIFESEGGDEEYEENIEEDNEEDDGDEAKDYEEYEEKGDGVKDCEESEHGHLVEQYDSSSLHIKADHPMEGTISSLDRHSEEVESMVSGSSDASKDGSYTRNDGQRIAAEDEDCFDQWHLPDKDFSAYPNKKWIQVAILGSDPCQPQWLSATSWATKTPTFTRASRLTSAQSDTTSTPPSVASTSSEDTEKGSLVKLL